METRTERRFWIRGLLLRRSDYPGSFPGGGPKALGSKIECIDAQDPELDDLHAYEKSIGISH